MDKQEYEAWMAVTQSSRFRWTEDEIFRLNGHGAFYYRGGEDGIYIKIHKDGLLEAGTYEFAVPHIGEAIFCVKALRQCADYSEAFTQAMEAAGKSFLVDMFSGAVPAPIVQAEKPPAPIRNRPKKKRSAPER